MIISNETEIKSRFSYLLNSIQYSLEANHVGGEEIRQFLVLMFGRAGDCIPKTDKISETFESVTVNYLWSYDNHDVLEAMVSRHLPDHVSLISEYQSHLSGPPPAERPLDNYTTEHYQKLTVRLDIDYKMSLLSMTYVRDLWRSFVNQFNIPSLTAVIDRISEGSLEIVWLVLPHVGDLIREAASQSELFFREHDIVFVAINDHILYDARQMVSSINDNCADYPQMPYLS